MPRRNHKNKKNRSKSSRAKRKFDLLALTGGNNGTIMVLLLSITFLFFVFNPSIIMPSFSNAIPNPKLHPTVSTDDFCAVHNEHVPTSPLENTRLPTTEQINLNQWNDIFSYLNRDSITIEKRVGKRESLNHKKKKLKNKKKGNRRKKNKGKKLNKHHYEFAGDDDKLRQADDFLETRMGRFEQDNLQKPWVPRRQIDDIHETHENNELNFDGNDEININMHTVWVHHASDEMYRDINISIHSSGMSQNKIYNEYNIDFIPDIQTFKLAPPPSPSTIENIAQSKAIIATNNDAFNDFYSFVKLQREVREQTKESSQIKSDDNALDILRLNYKTIPKKVFSQLLNDKSLAQWIYENDSIISLNCGIADSLIYILQNSSFSNVNGVCVVGNSKLKYKYAQMNVAINNLSDRIEIVQKDLFDDYVTSKLNESDLILVNWYNANEAYMSHFASSIMNDLSIRSSKPGRRILSYNKLLFDTDSFKPSYTFVFSKDYNHFLKVQTSLYMYVLPMYLSQLTNLMDPNYTVSYGIDVFISDIDFQYEKDFDLKVSNKSDSYNIIYDDIDIDMFDDDDDDDLDDDYDIGEDIDIDDDDELANEEYILWNNNVQTILFRTSKNNDPIDVLYQQDNVFVLQESNVEGEEIEEIQTIFNSLSSQLLYRSFISGIQSTLQNNVNNEKLSSILQDIDVSSMDGNSGNDEWSYLENHVFGKSGVDSCQIYSDVKDIWRFELDSLVHQFENVFFYDFINQRINLKYDLLTKKCGWN